MTEVSKRPVADDLSIVVPTLGRDVLQTCLLRVATGSMWPAKLIVVDQGRRSVVASWLSALDDAGLRTLYVPSSRRGRASGLNEGLRCVDTPFFGITDDDCLVDARWLEVLAGVLRVREDVVVSGKVLAGGDSVLLTVMSEEPAEYRRPRLRFDRLSGGNMGTSMDVFRRAGPFDESEYLRTSEDGEWVYRALHSGATLLYEPRLVVTHLDWRDRESRIQQYRSYARSHGGFYGKYLKRGDWFIGCRAVYHFARAVRTAVRGVMTRNSDLRAMGWAYLSGLPVGILNGLKSKDRPT